MRSRGHGHTPSAARGQNYALGTRIAANLAAFLIASPLLTLLFGGGDWLGVLSGGVETTARVQVEECRAIPWKLGLVSTCRGRGSPIRTVGSGQFTVTYEGHERDIEVVTRSSLGGTVEAEKRCALIPSRTGDGEFCRYWDPRIPASSRVGSLLAHLALVVVFSVAMGLFTPGLKRRIADRERKRRSRRSDLPDESLMKPIRLDP